MSLAASFAPLVCTFKVITSSSAAIILGFR
jgi:hypothetical protein